MADAKPVKLSQEILSYIETVVNVAKLAGIDSIIIEKKKVRAMDDDKTVIILQTENVPDLPFDSIGINRISVFASRYDIAKGTKDFTVDATVDVSNPQKPSFVRSLLLKGKGTKIDYRCASPELIQAPKAFSDTITHRVQMSADAVQMLTKGQSAMASDEVAFAGSKSGVCIEIKDNNSDTFEYQFTDDVVLENGHKVVDFYHRYPIKTITPLFKQSPDSNFFLSSKGMLNIVVNGINVFVLPRSN